MSEFVIDAEQLSEQPIDLAENKLTKDPYNCPVCPELEQIGVYDYLQMTVDKNYKILYRYDDTADTVFITAFMRANQSAERLLLKIALLI
jgi:mRNA-degrading endonuclease RelE of RelBE toxin-antitoxin system